MSIFDIIILSVASLCLGYIIRDFIAESEEVKRSIAETDNIENALARQRDKFYEQQG